MTYKERKRWVFFGLPFTFTTYTVNEEFITIDAGLLHRDEDDCYMYKVVDTKLWRGYYPSGPGAEAYPPCQGDQEFYPGGIRGAADEEKDFEDTGHRHSGRSLRDRWAG